MKRIALALRHHAWGGAGFAIAGFVLALLEAIAYYRIAGSTPAARAAFGYYLTTQAPVTAVLFPPPTRPDNAAGYVQLMAFAPLAILFAVWAVVSAVSFVSRVAPRVTVGARSREMIARIAAFAIAALIAAAAASTGAVIGIASGGETVDVAGAAGAALLLVTFAVATYAVAVLAAQLTPAPAIVTGGLVVALFFLNSLSRIFTQLAYARWLSPFRYFDLSAPLPPGGHFDAGAFAALVAIAAAGSALAVALFARRGARAPLVTLPRRGRSKTVAPAAVRLLGVPVVRDLYLQRAAFVAWSVAAVVLGGLLAAAARTSVQALVLLPQALPGIQQLIASTYALLLARMWFHVALLMFAGLTIALVSRWSAEDADGRLATVLSAPLAREALVVERAASLATVTVVLAALSGVAVLLTARASGMQIDGVRLFDAGLTLVLFAAVVGAAGSLFASLAPRAATTLTAGFILAAYLAYQVGGDIGLPAWLRGLSPFDLVREPLLAGMDGGRLALMVALAIAGLGTSILLMQRRDVGA